MRAKEKEGRGKEGGRDKGGRDKGDRGQKGGRDKGSREKGGQRGKGGDRGKAGGGRGHGGKGKPDKGSERGQKGKGNQSRDRGKGQSRDREKARSSGKTRERVDRVDKFPTKGKITSGYGARKDPKTGKKSEHKGIDVAAKKGTAVRATAKGTITRSGWQNPKNKKEGFGRRVTISHGKKNTSTYGHLDKVKVKVGQKVKRGDIVGTVGNTGRSTGPHLHYEERHKGVAHRPTFEPDKYRPRREKRSRRK